VKKRDGEDRSATYWPAIIQILFALLREGMQMWASRCADSNENSAAGPILESDALDKDCQKLLSDAFLPISRK